jgi:hypothetical protein
MKDTEQRLYELMHKVANNKIDESNINYFTKEQFLNELYSDDNDLNEIDFENKFNDASIKCLMPNVIVKWLNNELERLRHNRGEKEKNKIKSSPLDLSGDTVEPELTHIIKTQRNIEKMLNPTGDINIDMFIANITKEPATVFIQNAKMERSDFGRNQMTINTGIPALIGIVYDIDNEHFYAVTTCPGAGTCAIGCFARKAFYRMSDSKSMTLTRRLNYLMNFPEKYEEKTLTELKQYISEIPKDFQLVIRWNDAGDFFAKQYFDIAKNVTKTLLDDGYNVKSYAYTKRAEYVMALDNDKNFVVNFSIDANKNELGKINQWSGSDTAKLSHKVELDKRTKEQKKQWVPSNDFKQFFHKKGPHYVKNASGKPTFVENGQEGLKDYIFRKYGKEFNINRDSLKYTWELPHDDEGGRKYNVIVLPAGDSDISAQREDVRISFLLEH